MTRQSLAAQNRATPKVRSAFATPGLSATAMRFDPSVSSGVGVVDGARRAGRLRCRRTASPDDETVLAGIAERLQAHGKIERFGA